MGEGFDPLLHHGDVEAAAGLLDFAVNVHPGPRPGWLDRALRESLDRIGAYPDPTAAEAAIALGHRRSVAEVLATAGAAEAFTLLARLRTWRRPVVVHPQFTEPHAALRQAGHQVTEVVLSGDFRLDPGAVPVDADLVLVGNPTNPTGVLHPASTVRALLDSGPGDRLVVVDEAFMDAVPGETDSLAAYSHDRLIVIRSLTKLWGIPGVRAGYLLGGATVVADLRGWQAPWSVSTTAAAAMIACSTPGARMEGARRAEELDRWRGVLEDTLDELGIHRVTSRAPFVLAEVGEGVHARLRAAGIACRRADTFPGLGPAWIRIAVRPPELTADLARALTALTAHPPPPG